MKCALCSRQARGFGVFDPRRERSDPWRYPDRWQFCSMRCQDVFARLLDKTEGQMIDPTEMEVAAMNSCLPPLGEYVGSIGMDRPLADYGKAEVLRLVEVVIDAYQAHMLLEHERLAAKERAYFEAQLSRQSALPGGLR